MQPRGADYVVMREKLSSPASRVHEALSHAGRAPAGVCEAQLGLFTGLDVKVPLALIMVVAFTVEVEPYVQAV